MNRRTLATHASAIALLIGCVILVGAFFGVKWDKPEHISQINQRVVGPSGLTLISSNSCADLLEDLRSAPQKWASAPEGKTPPPQGLGNDALARDYSAPTTGSDRAAGKAAVDQQDYSSTNTNERGVDEADIVKTDGQRIVTMTNGVLHVVDAKQKKITASLDIGTVVGAPRSFGDSNILLSGHHALILINSSHRQYPLLTERQGNFKNNNEILNSSQLVLVDLAEPPTILSTFTIDGSIVSSRQIKSIARIVIQSSPQSTPKPPWDKPIQIDQNNREGEVLAPENAPIEAWLPQYSTQSGNNNIKGHLPCSAIHRPEQYTGEVFTTILTFDLDHSALDSGDPVSILSNSETVYASTNSIYITSHNYPYEKKFGTGSSTNIYRFDFSGSRKPTFVAAGSVPGHVLNDYSLSHWNDHLRIATTLDSIADARMSESAIYIMRRDGNRLVTTGKVDGLGIEERIYGVRFVGPIGYVVTFRQTDPLYTIDLHNPYNPATMGELKITGYSSYLHPINEEKLIGVGREATLEGRILGTQVSLFNVRNLADPKIMYRYTLASSISEAEIDPHAFLYWKQTSTLVIPLKMKGTGKALILTVGDSTITHNGFIDHEGAVAMRRSFVIDRTLWTLSSKGLKANDLLSLTTMAWLPF